MNRKQLSAVCSLPGEVGRVFPSGDASLPWHLSCQRAKGPLQFSDRHPKCFQLCFPLSATQLGCFVRFHYFYNPSLLFSELHLHVFWWLLVVGFAVPNATPSVRMELVCGQFSLGQVEFSSLESEQTCFRWKPRFWPACKQHKWWASEMQPSDTDANGPCFVAATQATVV